MYWKCLSSIMYDVLMTFLSKVIFRVVGQQYLCRFYCTYMVCETISSAGFLSGETATSRST